MMISFGCCVKEFSKRTEFVRSRGIMFRVIVIFVFGLAGCLADASATQVVCGETPSRTYWCLGKPRLINMDISKQCLHHDSECDRMKCIFNKSGWLNGGKVDKKKVSDHFAQFAEDYPAWSPAVHQLKAACVGDHDLPALGPYVDCPAFDVMHCAITSFIKNATPSQWKSTASCQDPRYYAAACPVCPNSCYTLPVPYGTCNACHSLPKSAKDNLV